jgi:hypothetical protein
LLPKKKKEGNEQLLLHPQKLRNEIAAHLSENQILLLLHRIKALLTLTRRTRLHPCFLSFHNHQIFFLLNPWNLRNPKIAADPAPFADDPRTKHQIVATLVAISLIGSDWS